MASDVDIANLALARLGDDATIATLDPPEGSVQAERASRFYPIARDALLEMHAWAFATRRANLGLLTQSNNQWQYTYAVPNGAVNILAILDPAATDDTSAFLTDTNSINFNAVFPDDLVYTQPLYTPQPFTVETLDDGTQVILTNQQNALCRYTTRVTDTSLFSPLFIDALGWYLASMLAGPIYKGEVGMQMTTSCMEVFTRIFNQATTSDANSRRLNVIQSASNIAARA